MDSNSYSHSSGYGSAHLIKIKTLSTQSIEKSRPTMDTAEVLGIKGIQSQIIGTVAKANIIKGPSKIDSFLIGFVITLFLLFIVRKVKN